MGAVLYLSILFHLLISFISRSSKKKKHHISCALDCDYLIYNITSPLNLFVKAHVLS